MDQPSPLSPEPREPLAAQRGDSDKPRKNPKDFSRLSQRLTWWTVNGLATAVVIIVALASGREIIDWWRGDDPRPVADNSGLSPYGPGGLDRRIQFGKGTATTQSRRVSGDAATAEQALRDLCREAIKDQDEQEKFVASATEPGPGERKLLATIAGQTPLETRGAYRIDRMPGGVPMMAVSRNDQAAAGPVKGEPTSLPKSGGSPPAGRRVVALGIAMPSGGEWGLYLFRAGWTQATEKSSIVGISLPPNAEISLSVADESGTTLTAIHGRGKLEDWEQFFRSRPSGDPWKLSGDWQTATRRRQFSFSPTGNASVGCDVQLGEEGGRLWGLITLRHGAAANTTHSEQKKP